MPHPAHTIATWFGSGKTKFAPGTSGSIATVPFFYLMNWLVPDTNLLYVIDIFILIVGTWATNIYMRDTGKHDPKEVVVDEVVGQFLVLTVGLRVIFPCAEHCSVYNTIGLPVLCFALFRFFDILKPWPIKWCDTYIKGGFGVMFDDILAAVYGIICLHLLQLAL